MKNYADRGGCYPPQPSALADNTLLDLHNSSYHTKAEFNNCFIIQPSGSADYFDNVMTKFMINNRTGALKTDVHLFLQQAKMIKRRLQTWGNAW